MSSSEPTTITRWWLVRHAPVVDAALRKLSGQADIAADTSDGAAFAAVAARLPKGALWITSHLTRTQQTAEALWAAGAEQVEPIVDEDFAEQAFGAWTGMTWAEIGALDDAETQAFWDAPATVAPPENDAYASESFAAVCDRVAQRLDALSAEHAGRDIVCVAHAGAIRAAVAHALGLTPDQALALDILNTSLTRIDHLTNGLRVKRGGSWRVAGINMI